MNHNQISDKNLYKKCLELSNLIKLHKNQFLALIPEVDARQLYLKHDMHSIYEFAAKLAGIPHETTRRVLKLSQRIKDLPDLNSLFLSGEVGWSKMELISRVANSSNQKELSQKVQTLSQSAIELMVKDAKNDTVCMPEWQKFSAKMSTKTINKLKILKKELETEAKRPLSWNQTLARLIDKIDQKTYKKNSTAKSKSRYIPVAVKREVFESTNRMCSHPKCNKIADVLHHKIPYAISKSHESLTPLCNAHHELVHHENETWVDIQYQKIRKNFLKPVDTTNKFSHWQHDG